MRPTAFNRTSLESKPLTAVAYDFDGNAQLLIEPVWNRNRHSTGDKYDYGRLLIEPVWNRNTKDKDDDDGFVILLIEPVWNRNL